MHLQPAEQTGLIPFQEEPLCSGRERNTVNKAAPLPSRAPIGPAARALGSGGAESCLSVHSLLPHKPKLASATFGSPVLFSSKCWAAWEVTGRGTLCSAAAHSINLMRIFHKADGKIAIFCCLINTISKAENVQSRQVFF